MGASIYKCDLPGKWFSVKLFEHRCKKRCLFLKDSLDFKKDIKKISLLFKNVRHPKMSKKTQSRSKTPTTCCRAHKIAACQVPIGRPKWGTGLPKNTWIAKQDGKFRAKIFLDCQNKVRWHSKFFSYFML